MLELLPPRSEGDLPGDAEAWHRLYPWLDGDRYLLREGLALTTEVLIGFPADAGAAEPLFRWLEEPPVVRPLPAYTNGTGALPSPGRQGRFAAARVRGADRRGAAPACRRTVKPTAPTATSTSATGTARATGAGATTSTTPPTAPTGSSCAAATRPGRGGATPRPATWPTWTR